MTTYALPTILAPYSQEFGLDSNTRVFTSPFNGTIQTLNVPGAALWNCRYSYPLLNDTHTKILKAWLIQLRGQSNRFSAKDYAYTGQSTSVTATASQFANTATLSGSVTVAIGDYVNIGGELKMIIAVSTGTNITIEPPFRNAHSGAVTDFLTPTCDMVLSVDSVKWATVSPLISSLEFSGFEAVS